MSDVMEKSQNLSSRMSTQELMDMIAMTTDTVPKMIEMILSITTVTTPFIAISISN